MTSQKCEQPRETATQRLATLLLNRDVREFIHERRLTEPPRPWRFVVRDLVEATDGQIDVTHETLRQWYADGVGLPVNAGVA